MNLSSEEKVAKILADNEVLKLKNKSLEPNSMYNLGEFLQKCDLQSVPLKEKYIFIK